MSNNISGVRKSDRSKIDLADKAQAKSWARELGVGLPELAKLVEKAGNSAAAVRKQLGDRIRSKAPGGAHLPGSKAST